MRPPPPRRSLALPLLLSLAGHALLVAALTLIPSRFREQPDFLDTEVPDGVKLSLDALPRQRLPLPAPVESQDEREFLVSLGPSPIIDGGPAIPAPAAGPGTSGLPGPAALSPVAGNGVRSLLAVPATARSVVYLLDRSTSMGLHGALDVGRREVLASLVRLRPGTLFQVIPYHRQPDPLVLGGSAGLVPLGPALYEQAARALAELRPSGSTDHVRALLHGLALRPDLLFLLTDADDMTAKDVAIVTAFNRRRTAIHTVELTVCRPRPDSPLQRLAAENGGTCRRVAPGE